MLEARIEVLKGIIRNIEDIAKDNGDTFQNTDIDYQNYKDELKILSVLEWLESSNLVCIGDVFTTASVDISPEYLNDLDNEMVHISWDSPEFDEKHSMVLTERSILNGTFTPADGFVSEDAEGDEVILFAFYIITNQAPTF